MSTNLKPSKVKKKSKVRFGAAEPKEADPASNTDDNKQAEAAAPFQHTHQKTAHALQHAKMVEKGRKFWEQKEQYEPLSDVEWWQLKAAKDFETGIGQKFYRHGTLSTWTDEQIAALQKDMQQTLTMAGYAGTAPVELDNPQQQVMPGKKVSANLDDFAAEIQKQQEKQTQPKQPQQAAAATKAKDKDKDKEEEDEEKDPLYDFDDEIIHTGHSDEEDDDGKQSQYEGTSMSMQTMIFDPTAIKELSSMDELAGKFDAKTAGSMNAHRRTRTEALRFKLQNMQKELDEVSQLSQKQGKELDEKRASIKAKDVELSSKLNGLTGALQSANDELDRAEEQISEKDEEIVNLKRELAISKQMNTELAQTALDANSGITADDLLKQRIKDANRFAFVRLLHSFSVMSI